MAQEDILNKINEKLDGLAARLDDPDSGLESINSKLVALSSDVERLQDKAKGIKDEIGLWHQRDKREIDEIKKHLDLPIMSDIPEV